MLMPVEHQIGVRVVEVPPKLTQLRVNGVALEDAAAVKCVMTKGHDAGFLMFS